MSTLTPYLCCADAVAAIAFYQAAFGAVEVERWTADDGRIGHAQLDVRGSAVYLADEHPEIGVVSPTTLGRTPVSFVLAVPDADAAVDRAVAAGATVERPVTDQPRRSRRLDRRPVRAPLESERAEHGGGRPRRPGGRVRHHPGQLTRPPVRKDDSVTVVPSGRVSMARLSTVRWTSQRPRPLVSCGPGRWGR